MGKRTGTPARRTSDRQCQVRLGSSQSWLHGGYSGVSTGLISVCFVHTAGCRLLQDLEVNHVEVDACGDAQSAAEGAALGLFHYDQLKSKKKTKVTTQLHGR